MEEQERLIQQYRHAEEAQLANGNFLTSKSLIMLQACVIYLAGLRTCQASAQQWTLLALAARIATALGLPQAGLTKTHDFETIIGQRL